MMLNDLLKLKHPMYGQIFQVLIMLNRNTRKFVSGFIFRYDPKAEIITMYGKIAA